MNFYDIDICFIDKNNPWAGTPAESIYSMTPRKKGVLYEEIVSKILIKNGYKVMPSLNPGHDRIINGIKSEIKFGLTYERNNDYGVVFNHIGFEKDWLEIYFGCINGDGEIIIVKYTKDNLPKEYLAKQQGGNKASNDDFMINAKNSKKLLFDKRAIRIV